MPILGRRNLGLLSAVTEFSQCLDRARQRLPAFDAAHETEFPFVIINHYPPPISQIFPRTKFSTPLVPTDLGGYRYLVKLANGEWWEIQAISMDKARLQAQQLEKLSQTLLINPC